jgi:hypothetical protein
MFRYRFGPSTLEPSPFITAIPARVSTKMKAGRCRCERALVARVSGRDGVCLLHAFLCEPSEVHCHRVVSVPL